MKKLPRAFTSRKQAVYISITFCVLVTTIVLGIAFRPVSKSSAHPASAHGMFARAALLQGGLIPPSDAQCRASFGIACYSPQEMRQAYHLTPLTQTGFTGKGQTIVIIDSYGSPTITQDLKTFDAGFGIPDPPSFQVLAPLGTVPFDDTNPDMDGWALETTIDVEWSHAMAPDASIVLLTSPVDETQGIQGLPEFLSLEQYALDHHLGNIFSQSWGTTENTLMNSTDSHIFQDYDQLYQRAAAQHVTVLAISGDFGPAGLDVNNNFYTFPTVQFPGSSPYVTTVGGTTLKTDTQGNYQSETTWDPQQPPTIYATGGGVSQYYHEPDYQQDLPASVQNTLKGFRGVPDIAADASVASTPLLYFSFRGEAKAGYYDVGGTSISAPLWAGVIAVADQLAHRSLGFLNPALYKLGHSPVYSHLFHDITQGSNNTVLGVPGFDATPGWDFTTGWGSPDSLTLVPALALLAGR